MTEPTGASACAEGRDGSHRFEQRGACEPTLHAVAVGSGGVVRDIEQVFAGRRFRLTVVLDLEAPPTRNVSNAHC